MTASGAPRACETENAPPSYGHRSQAIMASGFLFTGGQVGAPLARSAQTGTHEVADSLDDQLALCLGHLEAVTAAAGGTRDHVVEVAAFVAKRDSRAQVEDAIVAKLGRQPQLLRYEEVADVALHGLVELDWVACLDESIQAARAAEIIGPLGQLDTGTEVVVSGPFLITNGVIGTGADMITASDDVFAQIAGRLGQKGASLHHIVKMVVFIDDFDHYPAFNAVTQKLLTNVPLPTRSVVVAPTLADGAVRIDIVAQP